MTFLPGIPTTGEAPSQSQSKILSNFTALNTVFGVDHLAFNAVNGGKHSQSTYRSTGVFPAPPGNLVGEGSVYVSNTAAARQQLYYQRESAGIEIPITSIIGGFCRVQAGALVGDQFNVGAVANPAAGTYTITLTNNMTSTNYCVFAQVNGDVNTCWVGTFAVGSFQVFTATAAGTLANRNFSVLIIGEIA